MKILASPLFVLGVAFFSFFTFCSHFIADGALYWDTAKIYTEFRDNLQALNQFGEISWWFPHNQTGFPGYYHSILGIPSLINPVFVMLGLIVWVLGKAGFIIHNYHPLYVTYFGFLVPLLFLFGVRELARRIWKNPLCTGVVVILTAFSPGFTFHLSDIGYLEPTAYGLFFCAYFIDYIKQPTKMNYWKLLFSICLVTISGTHAALYWNAYFLPGFICLVLLKNKKIPYLQMDLFMWAGLLFSLSPLVLNAVVFMQGKELIRSSIGMSQAYPFDRLIPGNPLEALITSLPGFGFDWNSDRTYWKLMPLSNLYHSSYHYMGILSFPLFIYALLKANRTVRRTLLLVFSLFFGIIILSGYSPIFASFLRLPTPFQSCNHFSDAAFKSGGFLIIIYGVVDGLRVFIRRRKRDTQLLVGLLVISTLFSFAINTYFLGSNVAESLSFGMLLFWTFIFSILLFWLRNDRKTELNKTVVFLICAILIDVSSQSYLWVRNIVQSKVTLNSGWPAYAKIDETIADDGIGLKIGKDRQFYTNLLLMYPAYFQWQLNHFDPMQFPYLAAPSAKEIHVEKKTFNTLKLNLSLSKADTLFIRDSYSPYWKAFIDGKETTIEKLKENYKGIRISEGNHTVFLQFSPGIVPVLVLISYLSLVSLFLIFIKLSHSTTAVIYQKHVMAGG